MIRKEHVYAAFCYQFRWFVSLERQLGEPRIMMSPGWGDKYGYQWISYNIDG